MQKEIDAALKAVEKYKPRNDGEAGHVELVRSLLADAATRVGYLDDYADGYERAMAVHAANDARLAAEMQLQDAQAGVPQARASAVAADESA